MRGDIEAILGSNRDAIIIINGDHGPYLTKNCTLLKQQQYPPETIDRLDIQDRFGAFLAVRWPDSRYEPYDDITVLQHLFPAVFSYLAEDSTILGTKSDTAILGRERKRIAGLNVNVA